MAAPRRFHMRWYWRTLLVIVLLAVWPLGSNLVAGAVASANDCFIHEGLVHPCLISGVDMGGVLHRMAVLGWYALVTVPIGYALLALWFGILAIHRLNWRRPGAQS